MAGKKKYKTINEVSTSHDFKEEVKEDDIMKPTFILEKVKEMEKKKSPPIKMITFDMYFRTLNKPPHHKAGMEAYLPKPRIQGKKPLETWKRLFKDY